MHVFIYIYVYMYVCMYVCVFVDGCMNVSMHECMCIYMRHTLLLWFSFSRFNPAT